MPNSAHGWTRVAVEAYNGWSRHKAPRMGAALSYYTLFSLAPLLIVAIFIAGMVFGQEAARGQIFQQMRDLVGDQGARAIEGLIRNARQPSSGILPGIIGLAALLFGATGVFTELRDSLNTVWEVPPETEGSGVMEFLRDRFFSFLMVLSIGFILLVSLLLSAVLSAAGKYFGQILPIPGLLLQLINLVLSFCVITLLFAAIYKLLPEREIHWEDVWLGAAVTSFLFAVGKLVIGLYLGTSSVASTYGAAGSLVIVLVWVYYSAQIFFFGAEFTRAWAIARGSHSRQRARPKLAPHLQPQTGSD
jgi:membrane protein